MRYATSTPTNTTMRPSTLAGLRTVIPARDSITFGESLRIAEVQAAKLLSLSDIDEGPIPSEIVTELPRVHVVYNELPVSGTSHWNGNDWIITLNTREGRARQRFTLMHEFKHIIDHGHTRKLYKNTRSHRATEQAEHAADYFAGCVLIPRRLLKRAWGNSIQRPEALARHFNVSIPAITVRLTQTGLTMPDQRCARPIHSTSPHQQFRTIRRYKWVVTAGSRGRPIAPLRRSKRASTICASRR